MGPIFFINWQKMKACLALCLLFTTMITCPHCTQFVSDAAVRQAERPDHCPVCLYSWSDATIDKLPLDHQMAVWSLPPCEPRYAKCPYNELDPDIVTTVTLGTMDPPVWHKFASHLTQLTNALLDISANLAQKEMQLAQMPCASSKDRFELHRRIERAKAERNSIMYYQIQAQHILYLGTQGRLSHEQVRERLVTERTKVRDWFTTMKKHYAVPPMVLFPVL